MRVLWCPRLHQSHPDWPSQPSRSLPCPVSSPSAPSQTGPSGRRVRQTSVSSSRKRAPVTAPSRMVGRWRREPVRAWCPPVSQPQAACQWEWVPTSSHTGSWQTASWRTCPPANWAGTWRAQGPSLSGTGRAQTSRWEHIYTLELDKHLYEFALNV